MEYSGSRTSGHLMSFGLLLLLAVVTGALGSGHSHRKLLQSITVPAPAIPPPTPAKLDPAPPAEIPPGPSQILPPPPPPPTLGTPRPPNPPESSIPGADPPLFDSVTRPSPPPPTPELSPPPTTTGAAAAPGTRTWNDPEKAGVVIAVIAGMLQVAVVGFLLVKRRQMLAAVDYEDFDDELSDHHSDQASHNYRRHPEHSA